MIIVVGSGDQSGVCIIYALAVMTFLHLLHLVPPVETSSQPKRVGKKNKQGWKGWVAVDTVPEAGRAFWAEVVPGKRQRLTKKCLDS